MATIISHALIPLAIGSVCARDKLPWSVVFVGVLCAMLPDADVLTFKFGIAYESPYGHRGMTHSLVFAAMLAALATTLISHTRSDKHKRFAVASIFLFLFASAASHGVLDAMTSGGLGVEFLWPFSEERYFLPWHFIKVSPIGLHHFLNERGLQVIQSELATIWLPCAIYVVAVKIFQNFRAKQHHE